MFSIAYGLGSIAQLALQSIAGDYLPAASKPVAPRYRIPQCQ